MANKSKKTNNKKMNKVELSADNTFRSTIINVIKTFAIVLVIFGLFYLLTIYLTNKKDKVVKRNIGEAIIQYDEILAGSSFDISNDDYLVIYYDKSNEQINSNITTAISSYEDSDNSLDLYTVDMSSAFNKALVSDVSNNNPKSANELKISAPTLIKFSDSNVSEYIEGTDNIVDYLK